MIRQLILLTSYYPAIIEKGIEQWDRKLHRL